MRVVKSVSMQSLSELTLAPVSCWEKGMKEWREECQRGEELFLVFSYILTIKGYYHYGIRTVSLM